MLASPVSVSGVEGTWTGPIARLAYGLCDYASLANERIRDVVLQNIARAELTLHHEAARAHSCSTWLLPGGTIHGGSGGDGWSNIRSTGFFYAASLVRFVTFAKSRSVAAASMTSPEVKINPPICLTKQSASSF
jgi:hypothetical protein